jgi:hypothetical protein
MQITLPPHICAYLDVMGGAKIFLDGKGEAAEFFLASMIDFEHRLNGMRHDGAPVVKTFTDNIFAAIPLSATGKVSVGQQVAHFLQEVMYQVQHFLLVAELPLRGAITIGDMCIDKRIAYGPAVVHAVAAEEKAVYPRVVLDDSVLQALPDLPMVHETLVFSAADGVSSLSHLGLQYWLLKRHREVVARALSKHRGIAAIEAKYYWLLEYHNAIERRINRLGLVPDSL